MTSLTHPRLFGLGRNPAAPDDVLARLAAHDHGRHGIHLRRGRLPDAVVEALLTHGGGDSAFLLRADRLSPGMLRRIEGHPDPAIRDAPADFVRSMVENEAPIGIDGIEEAYGRPRTALAAAPDPKVRAAVARSWWERPLDVQVTLLADPDPQVRATATLHAKPGVPAQLLDRCLADPATRGNVARHIPLTQEQFAELTRGGEQELLRAVAENPHLTAEMAARLADMDDPVVRVAVARSRHADAGTRDRLYALVEAEHADGSTEAYVALHWHGLTPGWLRDAPLEERLTHLERRDPAMRRELASCPDLPQDAWRRLDGDPDLGVRQAAARRPDVPPEVLERLVRAHGDHVRPPLVEHPNFPRHRLCSFAEEADPRVRRVALEDPGLPAPALERLAAAEESYLRRGVAGHPGVTLALLERLLSDPAPEVADAAAANPALPLDRMHRILVDAGL
ncbi:hypothetical protein OH779_06035 [Actinacidiphila glaucinigra]|uniref:hypothetical protein n=1 Tax=Actinacidiphila glaucinigra TaxID=235986 RepID=UPI003864FE49